MVVETLMVFIRMLPPFTCCPSQLMFFYIGIDHAHYGCKQEPNCKGRSCAAVVGVPSSSDAELMLSSSINSKYFPCAHGHSTHPIKLFIHHTGIGLINLDHGLFTNLDHHF